MADLTRRPPRRWSETLAGYLWLARLVDKVRAFQAGTLGTYAYPSMLDRTFLRAIKLSPAAIERIVRDQRDDQAIGAAVLRHTGQGPSDIAALNEALIRKYRLAFRILDQDDGYTKGRGYPVPRFLQPFLWRAYQRWCARKASADRL